jgi:von Willebrand factor type A domain
MKLAAFYLLFALTLSAQPITGDSVVNRLTSTLQAIEAEDVHQPISMVIAVQTNYKIQAAIDRNVRKIGAMLEPLVSSERGEIEVLSYGDRVRVFVTQPFTSDSTKAANAIAYLKISSGLQSSTSNVSEAIAQATSDLETRPSNRRRIIVVIGENSNDAENATRLKDVVNRAAGRLPNLVGFFPLAP